MEKEEIQELIRTTITEMLSEMDQQEEHQEDQHQEDQHQEEESHEDQQKEEHQEEKPSELTQLRQELKELKAAIHHANFLNAGTKDLPKPELTPEQIFNDLINPKKGENK